ncbi:MAG: ABC transporter substrate-binding protein [Pseudolabrys sp.]|jgi:branched-chain amino acid transport system substrate-binding protein
MKRVALAALISTLVVTAAFRSDAEETIKIGIIAAYSGQFADTAQQIDNGIRLYMKEHGDTVAGRKIEIIRRDSGGPNPDVSKRLAQELVVRDKVDILAGFTTSPEALAAADVSAASQKLMVSMNGTASVLTTKSPYVVRTSFTLPQVAQALGLWAATKGGIKKAYTMVTDFGPGIDGEQYFQRGFKQAGGEIIGSVRTPLANPDFSPIVQRIKDANPESIFVFVPGGSQPAALGKAFADRGVDPNKVKIMSSGEAVDETAIKSLGELAIGRLSAQHYDFNHQSPKNQAFVKAYNAEFKRNPDFFSVGGYDGMHLIYEALKKTGGKADGESLAKAAKGMQWESPRGPMLIDPDTGDVVQTVYIRRVEKVGDKIVNVDIDKVENVKDPVKANQ